MPPVPSPFVHRAVLYGDDVEAASVVAARLAEPLRRGDPAVAVLGPAVRRAVEDRLGDTAGRVHFRDLADVHAESVEEMISNYLDVVSGLLPGGQVSTVVQYDPAHPHDGTPDFCYRVESRVNVAAARLPVDNTCLYDLRAVSGSDVAAARRTHPLLVVGGEEGPNPDFEATSVPTFVVAGRSGPAALRAWLRGHAGGLAADALDGLVLVVDEAVNALTSAGAGAWVDLDHRPGELSVRVSGLARLPAVGDDSLDGSLDGSLDDGAPPGHPLHDLTLAARAAGGVRVRTRPTAQGVELRIGVPR